MRRSKQKTSIISWLLIVLLMLSQLLTPQPVYARTILQRIGHGLKKTVTFIVKLPDKSTRWMGPVLGPIASNILTHNLATNSRFSQIFVKARRTKNIIDNLEEQQKLVKELRSAYADEAKKLENTAVQIRADRKQLATNLVKGDIKFEDYMEQAVNLEKLAQLYDQTANNFKHKSETVDEKTIISIVTKNATNLLLTRIKQATITEIKKEVGNLVRQDVIDRLIGHDSANKDLVIDLLVNQEMQQFLQNKDLNEQDFKDRLRDKIKQLIKDSKADLKNNWQDKVYAAMEELALEMKSDVEKLPTTSKKEESGIKKKLPTDEHGCHQGYSWDVKIGKCVQDNCNDIADAHWSYVKDCVCGSSGSIEENPKDPNKECRYSSNYEACPGCVYECVHLDEDCSLEGIGGY